VTRVNGRVAVTVPALLTAPSKPTELGDRGRHETRRVRLDGDVRGDAHGPAAARPDLRVLMLAQRYDREKRRYSALRVQVTR
jgi:hypothetical protein